MMEIIEFAAKLNGRQYRKEITDAEEKLAKENDIVVVFGSSDDLMEFRGAINDELDACDGVTAYLGKYGLYKNECSNEDCPHGEKIKADCKTIEALWCWDDVTPWKYATEIPHETFDIFEDGELYCTGIVFKRSSLSIFTQGEA